jgi:hypothetical protein
VATGIAMGVFPEAVVMGLERVVPSQSLRRVLSLLEQLVFLIVIKAVVACVEIVAFLINMLSTAGRRIVALL